MEGAKGLKSSQMDEGWGVNGKARGKTMEGRIAETEPNQKLKYLKIKIVF